MYGQTMQTVAADHLPILARVTCSVRYVSLIFTAFGLVMGKLMLLKKEIG